MMRLPISPESATVPASPVAQAAAQPTQQEDRIMARTTTTKTRSRKTAAAKATPAKRTRAAKATPATNGNTRMSHEDKLALVPEIVKALKSGTTFAEIRQDPNYPSSGLRKALADRGYNTKGEKIGEVAAIRGTGQVLAKRVAAQRENGVAWYALELATGKPQAELKELLEDNGYSDLVGRVSTAVEEEVKPKRTRKAAKAAPAKTTRKRGAAKTEAAPKARRTRRSRRAQAADPSEEG
jgi:hypothetical protein